MRIAFGFMALLLAIATPLSLAQSAGSPRPADLLLAAAARNDAAAIGRALAAGAPVDTRDERGRTALLVATDANALAAARALIAAGADVNARDQQSDSPYLLAGARGHVEILKATLAAGADLKTTNRYGGTALTPACHYGHVEAVRVLLGTRVDLDHVNRLGWTCLLEAVILGDGGPRHVDIVRMVIAAGANVNLADAQGVTPLAHARSRGQRAIIDLLVGAGAR
jgi:ankyrin repeat protein